MNDISELTARNLSLEELAERLRDHEDVAVRVLALRVIEAELSEYAAEEFE